MSTRYLVLTQIDGKLEYLTLLSSIRDPQRLHTVCGKMLRERFGRTVEEFRLEPWPL